MKRIFAIMLAVVMVVGMASMAMAQCNGCGKGKGPKGPNGPKGPGDGTCLNAAFGQGEVFLAGGGQNQKQKGKEDRAIASKSSGVGEKSSCSGVVRVAPRAARR